MDSCCLMHNCVSNTRVPLNLVRQSLQILFRQARARPHMMICAVLAGICAIFLPRSLNVAARWLIAWDIGAGLYLALALHMMSKATTSHMRARAREQDDGALAILAITLAAAIASVAAIVIELSGLKDHPGDHGAHLALATFTIACSWCFVHTIFAIHYAHEYYISRTANAALEFPNCPEPDYFDFLYFSFVIGTTSQTADVSIASRTMRRLALLHGVVAFFFNTTLLALTVNIAAGLL